MNDSLSQRVLQERADKDHVGSRYFNNPRPEVAQLVPHSAQLILDVGCGAGALGSELKSSRTIQVHGIEPSKQAANIASERLDCVWNCSVEDALPELQDGRYDCIILADVLEHLHNPDNVLSALLDKLHAEGCVVASLPNVQNWAVVVDLLQGRWDYSSEGILDRTHLRFFTRRSVCELVWNAGLRIELLTTKTNSSRVPKSLLEDLSEHSIDTKSLKLDGQTYQFLLRASRAPVRANPPVCIVVLNWNGRSDTLECLASLKKLEYDNYSVVVVDNNSSDDSVKEIHRVYPEITILQSDSNRGYAGGNNIGIRWALDNEFEYVLVLNNDTIVHERLLTELVSVANVVPEAGIYGPNIYFKDRPNILWFSGGRWSSRKLRCFHDGFGKVDNPEFQKIKETDYITGCALFIRTDVIRAVGLLDERYFLVYEEVDWCFRARALGYHCVVAPQAKVWHKVSSSFGGASSPLMVYFLARNRLLWTSQHATKREHMSAIIDAIKIARRYMIPTLEVSKDQPNGVKRLLWAAASWSRSLRSSYSDSRKIAYLFGIRDYFFRRFGDCPRTLRADLGTASRIISEQ